MSNNKLNIPYIKIIPVIFISIVMFKMIENLQIIGEFFEFTIGLLIPLVWGLVIAYLINPLLNKIETRFGLKRWKNILISYTIVVGMIIASITIIAPTIVNSIADIISEIPNYISSTEVWLNSKTDELQAIDEIAKAYQIDYEELFNETSGQDWQTFLKNVQQSIFGIATAVFSFTSGVLKFIVGMIISIYILTDKEKFKLGTKKMIYAIVGGKAGDEFVETCREIDIIFSKYFIGKAIDSLIIAIICFIGLWAMDVRYALLLSIIVGLTNMIPYFGPFIGAVPAVLITVFSSPVQALWVLVFILILQQFDGYILGPKILGDSVGLSPFWIIIAIFIGGGYFGVLGMLIAVPIMAVVKNITERIVNKKLKERDIVVKL